MLQVRWLRNASVDLSTIIAYIAERDDVAAFKLQDDIERATSQLPQHPYLYRLGRVAGTREIVVRHNYVIVYRVLTNVIEIVSVLHSRQRYPGKRP
jgi:addiction module RelE/StbE family toxin